ncbi:MAG: (2Fe-2S)-binding protein [Deltaproteobacteria bacterium]|nr:(2Fe-2S)-binding protein [Deltaproteobacteria bacterium]
MTDDLPVLSPAVPRGRPCAFDFEGDSIETFEGESVAVALWAAGIRTLARSTKFHRPRGAFCFDGHCASCLMRVDGRPNVRACMTPARAGLRCERQNAFPSAEVDLLAAADWMFPEQMDHHTLMTGNRAMNRLLVGLVRQMGGSGTLPDDDVLSPLPLPATPSSATSAADRVDLIQIVDVCIVGAGPAGLTAAAALGQLSPRTRVLVLDEQPVPGGSWLAERDGAARATAALNSATAAGVRVLSGAAVIGFFPEDLVESETRADAIRGTLAAITTAGLLRVSARRILYATGAYDQNVSFYDNDRPGVIAARACGRLAFRHGVRPGRRVAIVGPAAYGDRLAEGLVSAGMRADRVCRIDPARCRPIAAQGATPLRGLIMADADGRERRQSADVIAVAALPAPASELPRQHGAEVLLDESRGGFVTVTDAHFQTKADKIFCCGDVTGYLGPTLAEEAGAAAAAAITHTLDQR